jgi:hypothetical protein
MDKIKEKIDKIKELANRGENGEKQNAIRKLEQLKDKYNKRRTLKSFKLLDYQDCKDIMVHCILNTDIDAKIEGNERRKEIYCELSDEEYRIVCETFNKFYPQYFDLRKNLLKNFIIQHNLGLRKLNE